MIAAILVFCLFCLFSTSFGTVCEYSIYLRNVGQSGFGWTSNSVTVINDSTIIMDEFSGGDASFPVYPQGSFNVTFNGNNSTEAEINYYGVSFNGDSIYSSLPDIAYIPNYCTDNSSCQYRIEIFKSDLVSWTGSNQGYVYLNGDNVAVVLESDAFSSRSFDFSVNPGDIIYVRRPDDFAVGLSYTVYDEINDDIYNLSNDGNGPPVNVGLINLCGAESIKVTLSQLPAVIEPESTFNVAIVLPNYTQPTFVKLFIRCPELPLFSVYLQNSVNLNYFSQVTLPPGVFGTCNVSAISLYPGVNPFAPSLTQTVQIKYKAAFRSYPSIISMLAPLPVYISVTGGAPGAVANVLLTCVSGGLSQTWTSVGLNSLQYLYLNSPVQPITICSLSTRLDNDLYINDVVQVRTLDSPFAVSPITVEQINAFVLEASIPPSLLETN